MLFYLFSNDLYNVILVCGFNGKECLKTNASTDWLIRCVLLTALTIVSMVMNEQKVNLSNLSAENQQLIMQRSILENETEELRSDRDNFNWTLGVIMKFNTFPVNKFCPTKSEYFCLYWPFSMSGFY